MSTGGGAQPQAPVNVPVLPVLPPHLPGVCGVGIDLVDLEAFTEQLTLPGSSFARRAFAPAELRLCHGNVERLGARWAVKEAFIKAWSQTVGGVVLIDRDAVRWDHIEVVTSRSGVPSLRFSGEIAEKVSQSCPAVRWLVSLSHDGSWASALVVATQVSATTP